MKCVLFTLITLMCSVCYGQLPITKDRVVIFVSGPTTCSLSNKTDRHFVDPGVRKFMRDKGIQFVKVYGKDMSYEWHVQNKVTHYPAVVYYMRQGGELRLAKTYSSMQTSTAIGQLSNVRSLLGMKAETYKIPHSPLIPTPQYASQSQQNCQPGGT